MAKPCTVLSDALKNACNTQRRQSSQPSFEKEGFNGSLFAKEQSYRSMLRILEY